MKFNILSKSLLAAGLLAMVACSDDAPITAGGESSYGSGNDGDGYYMTVNVQLPSAGSRSETSDQGWGQSNDGNETGFDFENEVDNILIVLANSTDNGFITAGSVQSSKLNPVPSQNMYHPIAKLDKTNLAQFYKDNSNRTVNVFVFCNPTTDLIDLFTKDELRPSLGSTEWVNTTCTVIETLDPTKDVNTSIWAKDGFLMSNSKICTRQLPALIEEWKKYNTEATAFDLSGLNSAGQDGEVDNSATKGRGTVEVERNVARFDFRDGSKGNNTYNVIYTLDENSKQVPLFNVQLNRMSLANEAKQFYYLPRVSATGTMTNAILCGSETKTNYVVGPYAETFKKGLDSNFATYFNYPFFNSEKENDYTLWSSTLISDVIGKKADNLTYEYPNDQYYVWRYVTENVIPSDNDNQTMGRTTMVVFKGRLVATDDALNSDDEFTKAMAEAIGTATKKGTISGVPTQDPVIYYFNNTVYFGWENIKKAAIESALQFKTVTVGEGDDAEEVDVPATDENGNLIGVRRSSSLYLAVFGDGCMGKFVWGTTEYNDSPEGMSIDASSPNALYDAYQANATGENRAKFKEAVVGQNITIYESSDDKVDGPGYYFYYYYKNRHNDNGEPGTMGTMEFATVRNNVYKLAVTNIKSLGHPRIPENDPDKPTPDTPDESEDLYITVTCKVLPWVVRINNIEF